MEGGVRDPRRGSGGPVPPEECLLGPRGEAGVGEVLTSWGGHACLSQEATGDHRRLQEATGTEELGRLSLLTPEALGLPLACWLRPSWWPRDA